MDELPKWTPAVDVREAYERFVTFFDESGPPSDTDTRNLLMWMREVTRAIEAASRV